MQKSSVTFILRKITKLSLFLAVFGFLFVGQISAAKPLPREDEEAILNIVYENDIFARKDEGYTDGIRFAWLSSEAHAPLWSKKIVNKLSRAGPQSKKRVSIAVGQSMFTPSDLSRFDLITNDQPYAGWLYGAVGVVSDTGKISENIILTIGIVGPLSFAAQTQKAVHHIIGSPHPNGWDNQLHNEPGINLIYERRWQNRWGEMSRFFPPGAALDLTPSAGASLGNISTNAALGITLRAGYGLPKDYGPPRVRPSLPGSDFFIPTKKLGGYLFAGTQGRAVIRNIFLDGNSFKSSPHVKKKFLVADIQTGVVITYNNSRISYSHIFMTKEFKGQNKAPQFGSVTFSYRF